MFLKNLEFVNIKGWKNKTVKTKILRENNNCIELRDRVIKTNSKINLVWKKINEESKVN